MGLIDMVKQGASARLLNQTYGCSHDVNISPRKQDPLNLKGLQQGLGLGLVPS
jgi:hypothetical protein